MTQRWTICLPAIVALAAATSALAAEPTRRGDQCPAKSFEGFARAFLDDVAVQRRYTPATITWRYLNSVGPEPKTVSATISAQKAIDTYLEAARRRSSGLTEVQVVDGSNPTIKLRKPETDYQFALIFKKGACWTLSAIDDQSL